MNAPVEDPHRGKRLIGQILVACGATVAVLAAIGFLVGIPWGGPDAVDGLIGAAVLIGLPLIIGLVLLRKAGPAPQVPGVAPGQLEPLSGLRIFFAIIGGLIMLFAGGCSLVLIGSILFEPHSPDVYITPAVVLIFGGPPFLVGLLVFLLALKAGRRRRT